MARQLTPDQERVRDTRNSNILVSAAAGSGKTMVLTARIISEICDKDNPLDIEKVLIVTFTEAAAAEMKGRIMKELSAVAAGPEGTPYIRRQAAVASNALISTIDSFCLYLLRNHFDHIGLDPSFTIGEEGEVTLLTHEALEEVLEEYFERGEEDFINLAKTYVHNGKTEGLTEKILKIYRFVSGKPFPFDYLDEEIKSLENGDITEEIKANIRFANDYKNKVTQSALDAIDKALTIASSENGPYFDIETYEDDRDFIKCIQNAEIAQVGTIMANHTFKRASAKKDCDANLKDAARAYRGKAKDYVGLIKNITPSENVSNEEYAALLGADRPMLLPLLKLTRDFARRFDEKKREENIIDFSDMEHLALQILYDKRDGQYVKSDIAKNYSEYFTEVMTDEYQDSNDVQEMILEGISKCDELSGNRFMVGDVKQSIYGFRLAKPSIFLNKYKAFGETGRDVRIDLSKNFRSSEAVIDSVNEVFDKVMSEDAGGINYDGASRLYLGRDPESVKIKDNKTEILSFNSDKMNKSESIRFESGMIASRINELHDSGIKFGDMVVLVRESKGTDSVMKDVFEKMGIPTYIVPRGGYYSAPEIVNILNYIQIIDNPRDDIALMGVMNSVFGNFSETESATIRHNARRGETLYESLVRYSKFGGKREVALKCASFLDRLEEYRDLSEYTRVSELLERIFEDYNYQELCAALPGGALRKANLDLLLVKAKDFARNGYGGVFKFVDYISRLRQKDVDMGEAKLLDESADVVRIMTIHKSKGLEFPVCFVANLGKSIRKDGKAEVMIDDDLGIACDYIDYENKTKECTLKQRLVALKQREDSVAEEIRVMYVALTRASDKLILSGGIKDEDKTVCVSPLSYCEKTEAKSYMNWIYPVAAGREDLFSIREYTSDDITETSINTIEKIRQRQREAESIAPGKQISEFKYPYESLDGLYVKTTVSEIKKAAYLEKEDADVSLYEQNERKSYVPKFIAGTQEAGGANRGSAYHRIMELIDFTDLETSIASRRREMVDKLFLSKEEDDLVRNDRIEHFMESNVARRMSEAARKGLLYKEQPFVISVPASSVEQGFPETENVLVQGVVDVYFEEDDGIVILDYKTDNVDTLDELAERYKAQLDYYEKAISLLEGKRVKEKIIYSFKFGKEISI